MIDSAIILAAGRGRRLAEITQSRSKAMAPIAGLPIVARLIEVLRGAGIDKFKIIIAPGDREIRSYFRGISSIVFYEQCEPRGSADALRVCAGEVSGDFLVSACDSLFQVSDVRNLIIKHSQGAAAATLCVLDVGMGVSLAARSVVKIDADRVLDIIEKPSKAEQLSNITALPLYAFSSHIFREIEELRPSPRGEYELPEAIATMIRKGFLVLAVSAIGRHDLTDIDDFLELNRIFLKRMTPAIQIESSVKLPTDIILQAPVLIEQGVSIGSGVSLGPEVYIERDVVIAPGIKVVRAVITRGVSVDCDIIGRVKIRSSDPTS